MLVRELRPRPKPWREYAAGEMRNPLLICFHGPEWLLQWTAYYLSRWAFLEVLEYLGIFSVVIAVVFYFSEAGDRIKQKHYQAWQVINTAQGKGGSGGRIEAMQELNEDGVALVGVDASGAFLQGIRLRHADLLRANLSACDLRNSDLARSDLSWSVLRAANFRGANLQDADLSNADLDDADLAGADLSAANLDSARLTNVDLRKVDLRGIHWQKIAAIDGANIDGVRNAPAGFVQWALAHKAVAIAEPE
ncbi:MAG TPA: pentapeptide repeat-containing protein [Bryobacteraceae bacterium]|nr:pentapeptide repeat-containing protein [Bryobacteraceae bacterium]